MKYAVVYEQGPSSVGVTVPDLPGCFAVAKNKDEARKLVVEAIAFHIESLCEDGEPIPQPSHMVEMVETNEPLTLLPRKADTRDESRGSACDGGQYLRPSQPTDANRGDTR